MRIIQPCGPSHRDDGGPFYIKKFLNLMPGVQCDRKTMLEPEAEWGEYDGVIYVDWAQDYFRKLPPFVPNPRKPSVCWQSDTHVNEAGKRYRFEQAMTFRTSAWYMRDAYRLWASRVPANVPSFWLPTAADHTVYTPPLKNYDVNLDHLSATPSELTPYICDIIPRYDICFVGHTGDAGRDAVLDRLFAAFPSFAFRTQCFFRKAARVYHQSKIVFNWAIRHEINMRTFEALASRSFLLTDRQDGMDELGLKDGVHAALYDSIEEAIEKARWYLDPSRDALRRQIAHQGWEWCLSGHTYAHRARRLLEAMKEGS